MTRLRLVSTLIIKFHGLDFQQLKAPGCKNRLPLLMRKNKSKRLKHKQSFGAKAKLRNLSATFPSPQLVVNSKYLKSPIRKKEQLPVPGKGGSSPLQTLLLHSLSVSTQGQGVSWQPVAAYVLPQIIVTSTAHLSVKGIMRLLLSCEEEYSESEKKQRRCGTNTTVQQKTLERKQSAESQVRARHVPTQPPPKAMQHLVRLSHSCPAPGQGRCLQPCI